MCHNIVNSLNITRCWLWLSAANFVLLFLINRRCYPLPWVQLYWAFVQSEDYKNFPENVLKEDYSIQLPMSWNHLRVSCVEDTSIWNRDKECGGSLIESFQWRWKVSSMICYCVWFPEVRFHNFGCYWDAHYTNTGQIINVELTSPHDIRRIILDVCAA